MFSQKKDGDVMCTFIRYLKSAGEKRPIQWSEDGDGVVKLRFYSVSKHGDEFIYASLLRLSIGKKRDVCSVRK
jgi:hypothetical protein